MYFPKSHRTLNITLALLNEVLLVPKKEMSFSRPLDLFANVITYVIAEDLFQGMGIICLTFEVVGFH